MEERIESRPRDRESLWWLAGGGHTDLADAAP